MFFQHYFKFECGHWELVINWYLSFLAEETEIATGNAPTNFLNINLSHNSQLLSLYLDVLVALFHDSTM